MIRMNNIDILSPNKENFALDALRGVTTNRSKRAKWYSPCKSPLILANSPEPEIATLKLVHFAKTPRISFGNVKVGSSAIERLLIQNPHQNSQTLTVEKLSSEKGFNLEADELEYDGQRQCINLGPNEEIVISIKWEPKEAGSCREVVAFRWDTVLRVQVIVFGTAISPVKRKEKRRQMSVLRVSQKLNQNRSVKLPQVPTKLFPAPQKDVVFQNVAPVTLQENACTNEQDFRRETFVVQASQRKESSKPKEATYKTGVVAENGTGKEQEDARIRNNKRISPKRKAEDVKANAAKKSKQTEKIPKNVMVKPRPKMMNSSKPTALKPKARVKVKVPAKGVAQTRLKLVKAPRTSIPRHPLPFAAKNMYYDERWIDKQERGFTSWLNFILTPPDDSDVAVSGTALADRGDMVVGTNNATRKSQPLAPSREDLSLRAYTAKRKMTRLRRSACLLYQSEPLICVIRRIEAEVEEGRIAIRSDKKLHADLGIKRNVVEMLLSYSPLWLRIGLEVVYGEILPVHSNSDTSGLCRFITDRLLGNPDIAKEFAHPKVPGLYGQGYEEQLCKFTLKKLLLLVLFLDKAKLTRLIDHDPCLFNKDASFKSSRSILLTFSRDYLKGEGDVTKHLNFLGYSVTHIQTARDEYDYAVTKLAVDLRDGLRLTRVVELLTHNWQLSSSLRVPAISRLQKIHNVEVFMNELKACGVLPSGASGIDSRHIVDGHREKTLSLLWQIIFNFQLNVLINEEQLRDEINFLQKNKKLQAQLVAALKFEDPEMLGLARGRRESMEEDIYFKSERLSLLLKWCRIVCSYYGMKVENFTVSFSDGRALCYILHHYHPSLLPLAMISEDTTLTRNPGTDEASDSDEEGAAMLDSWKACYSPGSGTNPVLERLKSNERQNFKILAQKVQAVGGIPMMAKVSDMSHTIPDEKVVITYVSYLCARLLDLREETRAARCIQVAWKRFRLRKQLSAKQEMVKAACVLQARAKGFIARCRFQAMRKAAVEIQKTYRGYRARRRLQCFSDAARVISLAYKASKIGKKTRQEYLALRSNVIRMQALVRGKQTRYLTKKMRSARLIQSVWRQYQARHRFHQMKAAILVLQTHVRGFLERKRFQSLRKATLTLQVRLRATITTRQERNTFLELKSEATKLQAIFRGNRCRALLRRVKAVEKIQSFVRKWIARREFLQIRTAVVKIQTVIRAYESRRRYQTIKASALSIQRRFRALRAGLAQRERYQRLRRSCVKIQANFRGFVVRKRYMEQVQAATRIQARIRQFLAQRKYQRSRKSAVVIQRSFRGYLQTKVAQEYFRRLRQSSVSIQANFRRYRCQKEFTRKRVAAIVLQSHTRRWLTRSKFLSIKRSTIVLQTHYHAWSLGRHQYLKYHFTRGAVITLQAAARGMLLRQQMHKQRQSSVVIQATFRCFAARRRFQLVKKATVVLQCGYRALVLCRSEAARYKRIKHSALVVQSGYRGYKARRHYKQLKSAIKIQSVYRGYVARSQYISAREAVTTVQSAVRGYLARRRYNHVKAAAVLLQRKYRAIVQGRTQAAIYRQKRSAVLVLQSACRGYKARQLLKELKAVVKIQSVYRGFVARAQYSSKCKAVITLQAAFRGHITMKRYKEVQKATTVLQERYRAMIQGRTQAAIYRQKRSAVLVLQSACRGYKARRLLKELKAVVKIQSIYRGFVARVQYSTKRKAVITLQAAFRGHIAMKRYKEIQKATTVLQERYRAMIQGRTQAAIYRQQRSAVLVLQSACRGYKARRLLKELKAVVKIQSIYRGYVARVQYSSKRKAIVKLQAAFRGHITMKRYKEVQKATTVLQERYRAMIQGRTQAAIYRQKRSAVLVLQSACRGYKARRLLKELKAVVKIQSIYRGFVARAQYNSKRKAVITLQAAFRGHIAMKRYKEVQKATTVLQERYRAMIQGRTQAAIYRQQRSAALVLQSACRGYKARRLLKELKAVVKIQSIYRGFVARVQYSTKCKAVITLQAAFRGHIAMKRYKEVQKATTVLQERYRAMIQGRTQAAIYRQQRSAVLVLQSACRGYKARRLLKELKAVVKIQSVYRGYVARIQYSSKRKAIVKLQAAFRGHIAMKRYKEVQRATTVLQERYRAMIQGRTQAALYQQKRSAVLVLQSMYRGYTARRLFKRLKAAVVIQSSYRGFIARSKYKITRLNIIKIQSTVKRYLAVKHYHAMKRAVLVLQQRYRALIQARAAVSSYQKIRDACVLLQAASRGYKARKLFTQLKAAVKIQSAYRGFVTRSRYLASQQSAIKIQAALRRYLAVKRYSKLKWAAVVCQRRYRARIQGMKEYLAFHVKRGACLKLQAAVRGLLCRRSFRAQRAAAAVLQATYRAFVEGRRERQHFCELKEATVRLQACVRGLQARKLARRHRAARILQSVLRMRRARTVYCKTRAAMIKIQSTVRMAQERKRFVSLKTAVTVIQTRYRATLLAKKCHIQYHYTRGAIITIQAVARGYLLRQRIRKINQSAVIIQAAYRCYLAQRDYRLRRKATLTLQLHFRAFLLGRGVARNYERLGRAVRCIQSFYRGYKTRQYVRRVWAAVHIQARYRGFAERSRFLRQKKAAIALQAAVRGYLVRTNYRNYLAAALLVQSHFRAQQEMKHHRQKYLTLRKASITIQTAARGWAQRRRYVVVKRSALLIQRRYRATVAAETQKANYALLRQSCLKIQAHFRGWKARELRRRILAATTVQKYFRMHLARTRYQKIRTVVTRMQSLVRMKRASTHYKQLKSSVCLVQRRYRAKRSCETAREKYLVMRGSAIVLQTHWRGFTARRVLQQHRAEHARQQQAALRIQQSFRSYKRMEKDYIEYHITRGAVISIQAVFRGYLVRKFTQRLRSAIIIQAVYRGMAARRRYQQVRTLVITLQAMVRRNQASQRYISMRSAAVVLQQKYRAKVAGQSSLRKYQRMRSAVVLLQASFRCQRERATYQKLRNSAIVIKSFARMLKGRRDFCRMRSAATLIQTRYRALDLGKALRRSYCCTRNATITLQAFYRGWRVRRATRRARAALVIQTRYRAVMKGKSTREDFLRRKAATVTVQSVYRGWRSRQMVHRIRAALSIQAAIRGFITRRRVERVKAERQSRLLRFSAAALFHLSAIRIQRFYRQACAVALAREQINSVISIQLWWRSVLERKRFLAVRRATVTLQRAARRYLQTKRRAAVTLQRYARVWLGKSYVRKMERAALVIQALWRGYKVRSRVTSPEVKRARKRIASANSCATEPMKLCNRTRSALDYLLSCRNQTTILDALVSLELVTRLSSVCCEDVARGGALRVIYAVMRKCNRSLPHMEIIKHSVCILINVSKCPSTYRAVYEEAESIATLVELLSIFREKKSSIFPNTCFLLTLLVTHHRIRQDVLEMPKVRDTIRSIHNITERKYKLDANKNKAKFKMALTQPLSLVPPTPCKYTPRKPRRDWSKWLERVSTSQDPLQAVKCLLKMLDPKFQG